MCTNEYEYSQPVTIGGGSGYYSISATSPFGQNSEYSIVSINNATKTGQSGGAGVAIVSTDLQPGIPTFDGTVNYGASSGGYNNNPINGIFISAPANASVIPNMTFVPMRSNSLYVQISVPANTSIFVTVVFRSLPLGHVPPDPVTVHHDSEVQHNIAREMAITERLTKIRPGGQRSY